MARKPRTPRRQLRPQRPAGRHPLRAETLESRRLLASDIVALGETGAIALEFEIDSVEMNTLPPEVGDPELLVKTGDFNEDGTTDAQDIDLLAAALRQDSQIDKFDIDESGFVDTSDMEMLIHKTLETEYGDANLDKIVNGVDYAIWSANQFQELTGWATGDFNGDWVTDVLDFNIWNGIRDSSGAPTVLAADGLQDLGDSNVAIDSAAADVPESTHGLSDIARVPQTDSDDDPQPPPEVGDFNGDEEVDALDIDALAEAIRTGVSDLTYDLDFSGDVNVHDMDMLVRDIVGTEYGDANLDFAVNSIDRAIWEFNRFQQGTGWALGDFNGDGQTDVSDVNVWNSYRDAIQLAATPDHGVRDVIATIRPSLAPVPSATSVDKRVTQAEMQPDESASEIVAARSVEVVSADRLRTPRKSPLAKKAETYQGHVQAGKQLAPSHRATVAIDGLFARFRRFLS